MEALLKEAELKRKRVAEDYGGRKFVKRGELEKKELDKRKEQERREMEKRNKSAAAEKRPDSADRPSSSSQAPEEGAGLDDLKLPRHEVIRHLRRLKEPAILFGEDDEMMLARLKALVRAGVVDAEEFTEGQRNDFLVDITELNLREKRGLEPKKDRRDPTTEQSENAGSAPGDSNADDPGRIDIDRDLMRKDFDELVDDDKILVFFKRLLQEWEQELEDRPDAEKRSARGKAIVATFKQCSRYLKPLFKMCRKRTVPEDIKEALVIVVQNCMKRDYLAAMDQYIRLAIGNAPWPIGVTMVGIHERSAREKIYTNSVAHIMNDETTRKYLQSVKRLMTLCQRRYPSLPSKSVEFNSLANGSDLQTLLLEEKAKLMPGGDKLLQLPSADSS